MYSLQDDWNCMYSNWSFFYSHHHFSESVKHWSEEPEATSAYIVWCVASFLKLLHQSFLFVDLLHAVSAISESNFFDLNFWSFGLCIFCYCISIQSIEDHIIGFVKTVSKRSSIYKYPNAPLDGKSPYRPMTILAK